MSFFKKHQFIIGAITVFVIVPALIAARAAKKTPATSDANSVTNVSLISLADYQQNKNTVSANGTVQSLQEADLKSQVNAPVTKIDVQVGSQVHSGQTLVVFQNNDVAAQVAQAQAGVQAQQAALAALEQGTRSEQIAISEAAVTTAEQAVTDTTNQQQTAVANAYSAMLNSSVSPIPTPGNQSTAPLTITGTYNGTSPGAYIITVSLTGNGYAYSVSGLESATGTVIRGAIQPFGTHGLSLSFGTTGTINLGDSWTVNLPNTQAPTYLMNYNAYQAILASSQAAINAAKNGLVAAQAQLTLQQAGATSDQVAQQQALVSSAQAQLDNVEAQYSKTEIISPIAGTVSAINVKYGETPAAGSTVVSVVNKSGLQVKAFVSGDDLPYVQLGDAVMIGDSAKGTVLAISPSVDPTTRTAEVDVTVTDPANSGLVVGQDADITIQNNQGTTATPASTGTSTSTPAATGMNTYVLPIQAVQVNASGAFIYTVNSDNTLKQIPVTAGDVKGETISITGAVTPDQSIVSAATGLQDGETVQVSSN